MRENLRIGIRMLVLFLLTGGLLMLPRWAKADYIPRNIINSGKFFASQTIGLLGAATPEPSSFALVGLGAVLVALGFKRRRS